MRRIDSPGEETMNIISGRTICVGCGTYRVVNQRGLCGGCQREKDHGRLLDDGGSCATNRKDRGCVG